MKEQSGQNQCCKTGSWDLPGEAVIAPVGCCWAQTRGSFWGPLPDMGLLLPWLGVPVRGRIPFSSWGRSHWRSRSCCPRRAAQLKKGHAEAHWLAVGSSDSSGWSLRPQEGDQSIPPALKSVGVGESGSDWLEHVPSPKGCRQRDASSSLCLKAVKINLFLKSSPEMLPRPPCWLLQGSLGRPGLQKHPCGSKVVLS